MGKMLCQTNDQFAVHLCDALYNAEHAHTHALEALLLDGEDLQNVMSACAPNSEAKDSDSSTALIHIQTVAETRKRYLGRSIACCIICAPFAYSIYFARSCHSKTSILSVVAVSIRTFEVLLSLFGVQHKC